MTEAQKLFKAEKAGGNYGSGTKEMQARNYEKRKQSEAERESLFESALQKFNAKDIEGVGLVHAAVPIPPSCRLDGLPVGLPCISHCLRPAWPANGSCQGGSRLAASSSLWLAAVQRMRQHAELRLPVTPLQNTPACVHQPCES